MSFLGDIKKFLGDTEEETQNALQKTTVEVFRRIVLRSPVDKGTFRSNWHIGVDAPNHNTDKRKTRWDVHMDKEVGEAEFIDADSEVYISNALPYAIALEEGHSRTQAPMGIVRAEQENIAKIWDENFKDVK